MDFCFRCNRSEEEARLFDGIYINESVKVCEKCSLLSGIPIIKLPNTSQLKDSERREEVFNRLKRMAGIRKEKKEMSLLDELRILQERPELERPNEKPLNLVENFNWVIQRSRRLRKLTQKQVAEEIQESEVAINLIEHNRLPENAMNILRKLEQYFHVRLINSDRERVKRDIKADWVIEKRETQSKSEEEDYEETMKEEEKEDLLKEAIRTEPSKIRKYEEVDKTPLKILDFKKEKLNKVTIADLKEMQKKIEEDFPRKTVEETGREQLEEFGKKPSPNLRGSWFENYKKRKKEEERKKVGINSDATPSLSELAERKKGRDEKLLGDDIELIE